MKIGVTCYPTVGGSGILATRLGVEFAKKGHQTHFITYERPVAIQGVDHNNVFMHLVSVVEYPLFKYPPYTIALGSEMSRVSQKENLDLLHVHYSIPHATAAYYARELTGTPYVVTLHGSDVTILGSDQSYLPVNSHSVDHADAITAVSRYMAREAKERLGISHKIKVIPNFVDTEDFKPAPCMLLEGHDDRGMTITHISNFRPLKRIEDLVYAMCIINKKSPNIKLLLVGDGPERHSVERLIDRLDLRRNITLTGYRSDIPELLRCSDLVVICSETESAPLTVLEGMSSGLPIIGTNVGGIPEIVKDGVNGFLVPVKHPEAIAEKVLELASDKDKARKMGTRGRRMVLEKYSKDIVVDQYLKVYEKIL